MPLVALSLTWLSAGCAMHRGGQSLGDRIAQATVRGGAQPQMAIAQKLPDWRAPVALAARQTPASTPMMAANPPTTQLAALTPSQPVAAPPVAGVAPQIEQAPQAERDMADRGTTDEGRTGLALPPTTALPPPQPEPRHPLQAEARSESPAQTQTQTMSPERAATEAAALTAAIPLPDPLPMPFVNRTVPAIGPSAAMKPRTVSAQHSSAAPVGAASAPRLAAAAPAMTVEPKPAPVHAGSDSMAAASHGTGHAAKKVAARHAKSRHAKSSRYAKSRHAKTTVASRHSRGRRADKVASRRSGAHAARKNVVARRMPARPARSAARNAHRKRDLVDGVADRDGNRPKPVATSDKARAVVAPAETGGGTPSHDGWVGPLAPGSTTKVGVMHSSALERPRTGFSLASAAERLRSWAAVGWTRASPHDRAARLVTHRRDAEGPGAPPPVLAGARVRLADSG